MRQIDSDGLCEHQIPGGKCPDCCPIRAEISRSTEGGWHVEVIVGKTYPTATSWSCFTRWGARRSARREIRKWRARLLRTRDVGVEVIR